MAKCLTALHKAIQADSIVCFVDEGLSAFGLPDYRELIGWFITYLSIGVSPATQTSAFIEQVFQDGEQPVNGGD